MRFNMANCNSVTTPADPNQVLSRCDQKGDTKFPYREAVGSLMFLAIATRPEISYAVGLVSRFLENPSDEHVNAVKRIMRYLRGHSNYGIMFSNLNKVNLHFYGYSNADFAGDVDTRRSTTGFMFKLGTGITSWASELQKSVALSTSESEYVASSQAIRELVWLRLLLDELLPNQNWAPDFFMDNESAIKLVKNPVFHKRSKHIDIRFHFIREKFSQNLFNLKYVPTNDQNADIFTKALSREKFEKFREMMGIVSF